MFSLAAQHSTGLQHLKDGEAQFLGFFLFFLLLLWPPVVPVSAARAILTPASFDFSCCWLHVAVTYAASFICLPVLLARAVNKKKKKKRQRQDRTAIVYWAESRG